jgi:acyl-CoA thioesterase FadM
MNATNQKSLPAVGHCVYFSRLLDAASVAPFAELSVIGSAASERISESILTLPLPALASALLGPAARIVAMQIEYCQNVEAGETVSFSARITEINSEGAKVNYLVLCEHHLCVRGSAVVEMRQ